MGSDLLDQPSSIDRLGVVITTAGGKAFFALALECVSRQSDDCAAITLLAKQGGCPIAVEHGHLHVHQDYVEWFACRQRSLSTLDSKFAVFNDHHLCARLAKHMANQPLIVRAILREQDSMKFKRE